MDWVGVTVRGCLLLGSFVVVDSAAAQVVRRGNDGRGESCHQVRGDACQTSEVTVVGLGLAERWAPPGRVPMNGSPTDPASGGVCQRVRPSLRNSRRGGASRRSWDARRLVGKICTRMFP